MKPYLYITTAFFLLACGIVAKLPTAPAPAAVNKDFHSYPTGRFADDSKTMVMTVCNSFGLNLRTGRGTFYAVIGDPLQDGAEVTVLGLPERAEDGGTWLYVANNGNLGYVNLRYLCEAK